MADTSEIRMNGKILWVSQAHPIIKPIYLVVSLFTLEYCAFLLEVLIANSSENKMNEVVDLCTTSA